MFFTHLKYLDEDHDVSYEVRHKHKKKKKHKLKGKLKKFLIPLLIAYKLKFLTLVPVMIGKLQGN